MLRRGLAFSLLLAVASVAQAGVVVDLVPQTAGPYAQDESVEVDVLLRQDPAGSDRSLRFIQFDFNTTDPLLTLIPPTIHDLATNIRFWNFVGVTNCVNSTDAACGSGHFLEDVLNGPRTRLLSATYFFTDPADLGENTTAQRILPGDGTAVQVGVMRVRMPLQDGTFMLDMVNAAETNPDVGGVDVRWGFGVDVNGEPLTTWRANTGDITGGTLEMCVGPACEPPPCTVNFVSSAPTCDTALSRAQGNVIRFTFDGDVVAIPAPGDIVISALDAAGALVGGDLSSSFSYSLEAGNTILRIEESIPAALTNVTWYTIQNTGGWATACPFEVTYVSMPGNVNNDTFTDFGDLGTINANQTGAPLDDDKYNINADAFVDFGDIGLANTFVQLNLTKPAKPPGHVCAP